MLHETNVDPAEIDKFQSIASRWWDRESEFKPLHDINPLRVDYIERQAGGLAGKRIVDIGCGGGILAEALAQRGAQVTGIDMAEQSLKVARLHLHESDLEIDYQLSTAEAFAEHMQPASMLSPALKCSNTSPIRPPLSTPRCAC